MKNSPCATLVHTQSWRPELYKTYIPPHWSNVTNSSQVSRKAQWHDRGNLRMPQFILNVRSKLSKPQCLLHPLTQHRLVAYFNTVALKLRGLWVVELLNLTSVKLLSHAVQCPVWKWSWMAPANNVMQHVHRTLDPQGNNCGLQWHFIAPINLDFSFK